MPQSSTIKKQIKIAYLNSTLGTKTYTVLAERKFLDIDGNTNTAVVIEQPSFRCRFVVCVIDAMCYGSRHPLNLACYLTKADAVKFLAKLGYEKPTNKPQSSTIKKQSVDKGLHSALVKAGWKFRKTEKSDSPNFPDDYSIYTHPTHGVLDIEKSGAWTHTDDKHDIFNAGERAAGLLRYMQNNYSFSNKRKSACV